MKKDTKEMILLEAFKLFAINSYEDVTFSKLEANTKLTRGAIMYHFPTKELIFKNMCDKYLLNGSSIIEKLNEKVSEGISLKNFIKEYLIVIKNTKNMFFEIGVKNINRAYINITNQAAYNYPSFEIKANKWQTFQVYMWNNVIVKAAKSGEIRNDIDLNVLADLFEDIYCGIAYSALILPDGIDVERLEKAFDLVYNTIKKN